MNGRTQERWTREQVLKALSLYCVLPFGRFHKGNSEGEYAVVEAVRMLGAGTRSTHLFTFCRETPVRRRRWFDHCLEMCDAWEIVRRSA